MFARPIAAKVPGELPPLKSDHYIQDITKLQETQLIEIKKREEKLMSRIRNFDRLPDKGKRIKEFYEKVCKEIDRRTSIDEAAEKFSQMNIASTGQTNLNRLEWNGHLNGNSADDVLDSDDDADIDPLKIIAQHTMHEKKVTTFLPEESLVTQEDLEEIKSFANEEITSAVNAEVVNIDIKDKLAKLKPLIQEVVKPEKETNGSASEEDPHLQYLIKIGVDRPAQKERFKPFKTTISNVHDPEKEKLRKKNKHWEITAATPPLIQHGATKMLSLSDSVEIQKAYLVKLKEIQEKQAADRLAAKLQRLADRKIDLPNEADRLENPLFTKYREPKIPQINIEGVKRSDEESEGEDLDDEKHGGVLYPIYD